MVDPQSCPCCREHLLRAGRRRSGRETPRCQSRRRRSRRGESFRRRVPFRVMSQYVPDGCVAGDRAARPARRVVRGRAPSRAAQWRIGTEYEKVAVRPRRRPRRAVLRTARHRGDAAAAGRALRLGADRRGRAHRRPAAARKASITLEPGGQLELSGEQCDSVHCAAGRVRRARRPDRHRRRRARHRLPRPRHAAGQHAGRDRVGAEAALSDHGAAHDARRHPRPAHDEADRHRAGRTSTTPARPTR